MIEGKSFFESDAKKWRYLCFSLVGILAISLTVMANNYNSEILNLNTDIQDFQRLYEAEAAVEPTALFAAVQVLTSNAEAGQKGYYTIKFITSTSCNVKQVDMAFAAGTNLAGAKLILETGKLGSLASLTSTGTTLKYVASTADSVPSGSLATLVFGGIVNPATGTSQSVSVTTYTDLGVTVCDGPTSSAAESFGQINTANINNGAVTLAKIAANAVDSSKIVDGSIGSVDLASGLQLAGNACIDNPTLCVDANNNLVGIGTAEPDATLDVQGTGGPIASFSSSGASTNIIIRSTGNSQLNFGMPGSKWTTGTTQLTGGLEPDYYLRNDILATFPFIIDGDTGKVSINDDLQLGSLSTHAITVEGDMTFDGDGSGDKAKLTFVPGLKAVPGVGMGAPAVFSISAAEIQRVFLDIDCQDIDACLITGENGSEIADGTVGQILILHMLSALGPIEITDSANQRLGAAFRTLNSPDDVLVLMHVQVGFGTTAWVELSFSDNG